MLFSRTAQYAIQALVFMVGHGKRELVSARSIADQLGVPAPYLSKIMQLLSRGGFVESYRGPRGGFRLRDDAAGLSLLELAVLVEGPSTTDHCVLGLKTCGDEHPCPLHRRWIPVKERVIALLRRHTVGMLAKAIRTGKYRIGDLPGELLPTGFERVSTWRDSSTRAAGARGRSGAVAVGRAGRRR